jgi:hypothetical protein
MRVYRAEEKERADRPQMPEGYLQESKSPSMAEMVLFQCRALQPQASRHLLKLKAAGSITEKGRFTLPPTICTTLQPRCCLGDCSVRRHGHMDGLRLRQVNRMARLH